MEFRHDLVLPSNYFKEIAMAEAYLKDLKRLVPAAAYLEGEYGVNGLYVGVPCKLGARGLEQVIEITLTAEERIAQVIRRIKQYIYL